MSNKLFTGLLCMLLSGGAYAQSDAAYTADINTANNLYLAQQYQQAADAFTHAFAAYGGKGYTDDRYTAACSWAMAGNKDSAFHLLNHIATKGNFKNMDRVLIDTDLEPLYTDARWQQFVTQVKHNKELADRNAPKKQKSKAPSPAKKNTVTKSTR